ncbi:MAG: LCP family protein [bacterium]
MKKRKLDLIRLLAILTIICGIIYFYVNIFQPRLIPNIFRIGVINTPINILIVGTDLNFDAETGKRLVNTVGRTDSILLARIDPIRYKINLLSIPRDSFVPIPGHREQKINAANVFGGIKLLKETIKDLTGKEIDYYIEIDPYAVIKLVDLIGGVDYYVEKDMYYVDNAQNLHINLKQGWHKLSGKEAQDYMRFRHDMSGDIGRIDRQQRFLQAIFLDFAKPNNIIKAPVAIGLAAKQVSTDLPLTKIIRLANFVRMLSPTDIHSFTAVGSPEESSQAGSILRLDQKELAKIVREVF